MRVQPPERREAAGGVSMGHVIFKAHVPGIPPTATSQGKGIGRRRDGRPFVFTKKRQRVEEANAFAALAQFKQDTPPTTGPCAVYVLMCWPWRATEKRAVVRRGVPVPMVEKPDADNAVKSAVLDVLTTLQVFRDDKQVALMVIGKERGATPFWTVRVEELAADAPLPLRELLDGGDGNERAARTPEEGGAAVEPEGNRVHSRPDGQLRLALEGGTE